jgi:hypothetical protein
MHHHLIQLDTAIATVAAIEDPVERTVAWTEVMTWLQEMLPAVRWQRRNSARLSKNIPDMTYIKLAAALGMTESTVRRLVSEAEKP